MANCIVRSGSLVVILLVAISVRVPAQELASLPDEAQLTKIAAKLASDEKSSEYHTYLGQYGAMVVITRPGSQYPFFPNVVIYLYDRRRGEGSTSRSLAERMYFEDQQLRTKQLAVLFETLRATVLIHSKDSIEQLHPRIRDALFVEMTGYVHDIVSGLGAKSAAKKAAWLVSESAKAMSLVAGQKQAAITYGEILDQMQSDHFAMSQRMSDLDEMLLRLEGPASWADNILTVKDILDTAETFDNAWKEFRLTVIAREMEEQFIGNMDVLTVYPQIYKMHRFVTVGKFLVKIGPDIIKMAFAEDKSEALRQMLIQAFFHAYAAKEAAEEVERRIANFKTQPTPAEMHEIAMILSYAAQNAEISRRLQQAVVEANRSGDIGGNLLAWAYENVLTRPGAIDANIVGLKQAADSLADERYQMLEARGSALLRLTRSIREIKPLPWKPEVAKIIATADPLIAPSTQKIRLQGAVLTADALPVGNAEVVIEDPINNCSATTRTDSKGDFSQEIDVSPAECGLYTFVCTSGKASPAFVVISVAGRSDFFSTAGKAPVPIGPWENPEQVSKNENIFALTHRPANGVLSPASTKAMTEAAGILARCEIEFWSTQAASFSGNAASDGVRIFAIGAIDGVDAVKAQQITRAQILYGLESGKRAQWVELAKSAISMSHVAEENRQKVEANLNNDQALIVAFAIDSLSGVCGWPENMDRAKIERATVTLVNTADDDTTSAFVIIEFSDASQVATIGVIPAGTKPPLDTGLLDAVFCIDTTGSMADDIDAVKKSSTEIIAQLKRHCDENHISLQVGLVTYQDHTDAERFKGAPEAEWLKAWPMSPRPDVIRQSILAIPAPQIAVGGDVEEDAYAAYMCAMDARPDWEDKTVKMGWRQGAAKIIIPMCDAPPHEPDFEKRTLEIVSARAEELDPVHFYPLLLPKTAGFFDPTARALRRLADATGGEVVRVSDASALPQALVDTVKLAIRRHRDEVWRKENPPYVLYGAIGVMLATVVLTTIAIGIGAAAGRKRETS